MLGGAVNHRDRGRTRQRQLDADGSGGATCAEQDNSLAARVNDPVERHQEPFSISIFPDVFVAPTNCAINRTHNRGRLTKSIEILYHRDLVGKRTVKTGPAHRPSTANGVAQFFGAYLTINITPIQSVMTIGGFDHGYRGVASRRLGK